MADVFLSYASEDRGRVQPIVEAIEQAGFAVWWDRRIGLGSSFDREIERELDAARCVIVIWSSNSIDSDWVRNEAQEGLDRGVLLPLLIDEVRPPLAFRRAQAATINSSPSTEELDLVLSAVRDTVGRPPIQQKQEQEKSSAETILQSKKAWFVVAISVATLVPTVLWQQFSPQLQLQLQQLKLERSISVAISTLPNDPASVNFAAGLVNELRNSIAKFPEIRLVDPTDHDDSLTSSYELNGNLQFSGEIGRIRVQLLRLSDNRSVWSEEFNLPNGLVLEDQIAFAGTIGRNVRLQLIADSECENYRRETSSEQAAGYLCFALKENMKINEGAETDYELGLLNSQKAVELDPNFAAAYTQLANDYMVGALLGYLDPDDAARLAHAAVDKALALEPDHAMSVAMLAWLYQYLDLDYALAEEHLMTAIRLDPRSPYARLFFASLGDIALRTGNADQAVDHYRRAVQLYDADARVWREYAAALFVAGYHKEAVGVIETALRINTNTIYEVWLTDFLVRSYVALNDLGAAESAIDTLLGNIDSRWAPLSAYTLVRLGRDGPAHEMLNRLETGKDQNPSFLMFAYAELTEAEQACKWAHTVIEKRSVWALRFFRVGPYFEDLRSTSCWTEVMDHLRNDEGP